METFQNSELLIKQVYQDEFCRISISESKFCIYQFFHQLPQSKDLLRPSMETILSVARLWAKKANPVFFMLEVENGELLPSEDVTWVRKDVIPQLAMAGIRFVAYISQNNVFRQFRHEYTHGSSSSGKGLVLRVFQDRQEAILWIEQAQS